jgi:hypothetical protein
MATPLAGLQPLLRSVDTRPELTAEQQQGGPADPRHGQGLATGLPTQYPWEVLAGVAQHGPYGNEAQLVGAADGWIPPAGNASQDPGFDATPRTHAAPWPKGVEQSVDPDAVARQLEQSASIHASNMGGSEKMATRISAQQDQWTDFYEVDSGTSLQDPAVPGQLKGAAGGYGTTDRVSSFARQNEYGFDSAHKHRRYATGSVPGNYMWLRPGGRPMIKSQAGPAQPAVGDDSPFTGQDLGRGYGVQGAVLQNVATEYVAPPEPYLAPTQGPTPDPGPVSWW